MIQHTSWTFVTNDFWLSPCLHTYSPNHYPIILIDKEICKIFKKTLSDLLLRYKNVSFIFQGCKILLSWIIFTWSKMKQYFLAKYYFNKIFKHNNFLILNKYQQLHSNQFINIKLFLIITKWLANSIWFLAFYSVSSLIENDFYCTIFSIFNAVLLLVVFNTVTLFVFVA